MAVRDVRCLSFSVAGRRLLSHPPRSLTEDRQLPHSFQIDCIGFLESHWFAVSGARLAASDLGLYLAALKPMPLKEDAAGCSTYKGLHAVGSCRSSRHAGFPHWQHRHRLQARGGTHGYLLIKNVMQLDHLQDRQPRSWHIQRRCRNRRKH